MEDKLIEYMDRVVEAASGVIAGPAAETAKQIVSWQLMTHYVGLMVCVAVLGLGVFYVWTAFRTWKKVALLSEIKKDEVTKEMRDLSKAYGVGSVIAFIVCAFSLILGVACVFSIVKCYVAPNLVIIDYVKETVKR